LAVRTFRQYVDDQLVTVFGGSVPGQPTAKVGHYMVGNTGDIDTNGVSAEFRAVIASRIHGSIRYSFARGEILRAGDDYVMLLAPETARPGFVALHDVTGRVDAEVPETATRVLVLYRLSNGFAEETDRAGFDSRFDVQVRQALPFLNFTSTQWEMLVAVRNFFRETSAEQTVYDELLVIHPPKRIVGGVTIPEGESVLLSFPSANRDEAIFENPESFDVARDPNRHIAFAFGAHYCLGNQLARLEGRTALNALIQRFERIELAVPRAELRYKSTQSLRGLRSLPLVLHESNVH